MIGGSLAGEQPEFKPSGRPSGRPKGSDGLAGEPENLRKILDDIEIEMDECPEPFGVVLPKAIERALKCGMLTRDVDRTTYPKRLRRLWRRRQEKSLAKFLKYSTRDKK